MNPANPTITRILLFAALIIMGLLTACHTKPTDQPTPASTLQPPPQAISSTPTIDIIRNGYLPYNHTTTIGQALAGTFTNGTWKTFTTPKGVNIVEFDASIPFSTLRNTSLPIQDQILYQQACLATPTCVDLSKQIGDYCDSDTGQTQFKQELKTEHDLLMNQIVAQTTKIANDLSIDLKNPSAHSEQYTEETAAVLVKLKSQLKDTDDPTMSCSLHEHNKHANDPMPFGIQFSTNNDGTFQYTANTFDWSTSVLLHYIYN